MKGPEIAQLIPPELIPPEEVFSEFYRSEHDGLVRRAYLMLGDLAVAHDVVGEAFLAVYKRWEGIHDHGPYLNRTVVNGCRDAARRNKRERTIAEPHVAESMLDPADYVADILLALPFRQRAAIVLRYYGGCSEAEIAAYLQCRTGTVGSLIHRGLTALRRQLEEAKR